MKSIHILISLVSLISVNGLDSNSPNSPIKSPQESGKPSTELFGLSFQYPSTKKKIMYNPEGTPQIPEEMTVKFTLFGILPKGTELKLTTFQTCNDAKDKAKIMKVEIDPSEKMGFVRLKMPKLVQNHEERLRICLGPDNALTLQGDLGQGKVKPWLTIIIFRNKIPEFVFWIIIAILLLLSGLFSGLNLGVLSLDRLDLKIMINTGTPSERAHAKKIRPIRSHGNLLLCSLVFSNVLVNATLTLLIDELTDGITALIGSTFAIVLIGEIIPQAVCSRHGLAIGGHTILITKFFMAITFPLAFPMGKLLDRCLGDEIGVTFTRERLKEIVKAVKDEHLLENEEVGIISGALDLRQKTVKQIMRKIGDVFMLSIDAKLDYKTMQQVENQGYSRIPIYDGEITNVIAVLNVKQLIMVNYNDATPARNLVDLAYFKDHLFCVFENTRLDFMFRKFREGNRGHMAFVDRVNDEGPGDPYYERIGVVTMEDVLEELLQQDIMDESDVGTYSTRLEPTTRPARQRTPSRLLSTHSWKNVPE